MLSWQHCLGKIVKFNVMQVVISVFLPDPSEDTTDKQTNTQTSRHNGTKNTKHPNCQAFAPHRDESKEEQQQ